MLALFIVVNGVAGVNIHSQQIESALLAAIVFLQGPRMMIFQAVRQSKVKG